MKLENVPQVTNQSTPIVLDGLQCSSTDTRLGDCGHRGFVERCEHSMDAGANCTSIVMSG